MSFEEFRELPYIKSHFVCVDAILRKIYEQLSEEEMLCMKNDPRFQGEK